MSLRRRLSRLEQLPPPTSALPDEERLRRFNELLTYRGDAPDMLARQAQAVQLVRKVRERLGQC